MLYESWQGIRPPDTLVAAGLRGPTRGAIPVTGIDYSQTLAPAADPQADRRSACLAAAFESVRDGLLVLDDDGVCVEVNHAACELLGHSRDAIVGRAAEELAPAGLREALTEGWAAFLAEGRAGGDFEATQRRGPGAVVEFTARAHLAEGRHLWMLRDVTESRDAARLKSQFLENMNHELRTPLNGVIGITRMLEETKLDQEQREYVEALRISGEGLASVVEAVLDFSTLESGTLELADAPYDLRVVIEEVCSVIALGAATNAVEVLSYVDPELPAIVRGDEQRVRHVLANLVGNAFKFTHAGEIRVSAHVSREGLTPHARIEVADSGIGINPIRLHAIFDSFAQADGSATRRYAGAGLGLAIARELVAMMGGQIGVDSTPGEGSTFWFTLPLRDAGDPPPPQTALEGVRILVVHANALSRQLIVRQLEGWHAQVAAAEDYDHALRALRTAERAGQPFALALIDHGDRNACELDAIELARTIREHEGLRETRTVILLAPHEAHQVAGRACADGLLAKPAGQTRLYAELTRVIGATAAAHAADAAAPPEATATPGGAGRVLVAEDNHVNQLVAVRLLEQRGYVVDVAGNGREAIAMHANHIYDAIFMDCQMPEINGYEATREIRRREGPKRHTPIIAMTASTLADGRERCFEAGMDHHIGKPVRPSALDQVIARAFAALGS